MADCRSVLRGDKNESSLRLGLAGPPVPTRANEITPEYARRLAARGVTAIITHLEAPPELVSQTVGAEVRQVLADEGISIVQAHAYNPNLVHPNRGIVAHELERLGAALRAASALGAEMLISGCGSLGTGGHYSASAENHTAASRGRLIDSLRTAAPWFEEAGVTFALECHVLTTLDTPANIRDILDAVDSPRVRANFDPVNLIGDLRSAYDTASAQRTMLEVIGKRYAPCAHLKDVVVTNDMPLHLAEAAPGEGLLDMEAFFEVCLGLGARTPVVIEHLPSDRADKAIKFVRQQAASHGVEFIPSSRGNPQGPTDLQG